jgi:penicillin-binding protein 1A
VVLAQMAKGYYYGKEKKVYQLLLILNWKAIEGSATYFREYLRDYMKKWVDENKKRI